MPRIQKQHDVRAVANYLLAKAAVDLKPLDQLQLQKLAYLSHGWHLGLSGSPLIIEEVRAWPYGPVIPALYHEFKRFGSGNISGRARYHELGGDWETLPPLIDPYSKAVIDSVWDHYGKFTGNQLITLTHQPGTPWAEVTRGLKPSEIRDIPIPNELIRRYYYSLAITNQAKQGATGAAK